MTKYFANLCSLLFAVLAGMSFHVGQPVLGAVLVALSILSQFMKRWWRRDSK